MTYKRIVGVFTLSEFYCGGALEVLQCWWAGMAACWLLQCLKEETELQLNMKLMKQTKKYLETFHSLRVI